MSSNSRVLRPPQALAMLLAFLLASAMGGFLLAGLAVPLAAGVGTVTNAASGVFSDLPEELKMEESALLKAREEGITVISSPLSAYALCARMAEAGIPA